MREIDYLPFEFVESLSQREREISIVEWFLNGKVRVFESLANVALNVSTRGNVSPLDLRVSFSVEYFLSFPNFHSNFLIL